MPSRTISEENERASASMFSTIFRYRRERFDALNVGSEFLSGRRAFA